MNIVFFDTETTGKDPKDLLCQIAWKTGGEMKSGLFKPPFPIPAEAMAVHHITNKMLADKPAFKEAPEWKEIKDLFEHPETIAVAHNASFDLGMLKKEDIVPTNFICTLRVARALDSEGIFSQYKLQYLRYKLDLEVDGVAHSADGDVLVLEKLFERLLAKMAATHGSEEAAIKEMIAISSRPSLLNTIGFGKHAGKKIKEIAQTDRGYLEWLLAEKLKNPTDEEDWIYTLKTALGKLL
jgi:DNA polymerase III epsilon subunit-like protein